MSVFGNLLWDKPAKATTFDVRTPTQAAAENQRLGVAEGLTSQYGKAMQDPNFGIAGGYQPGGSLNKYLMDQASTDEVNRLAAAGGGGTGYSASRAAKAAVDAYFQRQKDVSNIQNQARANVGQMMVGASNTPYHAYADFQEPEKPSMLTKYVDSAVGAAGSATGKGLMGGV